MAPGAELVRGDCVCEVEDSFLLDCADGVDVEVLSGFWVFESVVCAGEFFDAAGCVFLCVDYGKAD